MPFEARVFQEFATYLKKSGSSMSLDPAIARGDVRVSMVNRAPMWAKWIRQAAFWASLLLTLSILENAPTKEFFPALPAVIQKKHDLSLMPRVSDDRPQSQAPSALPSWKATIFSIKGTRSNITRGLSAYLPQLELTASLANAQGASTSLPEGDYLVVLRAPGFSRFIQRIHLIDSTVIEPVLVAATSLHVQVQAEHEDGQVRPLPGATVLVGAPSSWVHGASTDTSGTVEISALTPGPHLVRIFSPGFEPYEAKAESRLLVRLRPVSTLRVHVVDKDAPQKDAKVFIAGVHLWPARSTQTGKEGYVDITGLKPGKYALYSEKGELISPSQKAVEILGKKGLVEITLHLGAGQFVEALVVSDKETAPLQGARVTWSSSGLGQFSRHQTTDINGKARLGPLSEFSGILSVRARGFVGTMTPVLEKNHPDLINGAQVISLAQSATVVGRVVDTDGFPIEGATVEVAGTSQDKMPISVTFRSEAISDAHFDWAIEQGRVLVPAGELGVMLGPVPPIPLGEVRETSGQRLTTDDKGYFRVESVPSGEVVVLVRHPDHLPGKSPRLHLSPGTQVSTKVVLGKGQPLRGRVLQIGGFPVEHARIQLSARNFNRRIISESDGTFQINAAPAKVRITIRRMESPLQVVYARVVEEKERHEEIQIELPEEREPAAISITDEEGQPVELSQVTLLSLQKEVPFKQTRFSQEDGTLEFNEAVGLKVRLTIQAPGFVVLSQKTLLKKDNTFQLQKAITVHGRVTTARGRLPASGAKIVFTSGNLVRKTIADETGDYTLRDLPPGKGVLKASHIDHGSGHQALRVKKTDKGRVHEFPELDLSPSLSLNGRVVDQSGAPLALALVSINRLSPYLPGARGDSNYTRTDEEGQFSLEVEREEPLYLYAATPGKSYGWSEIIKFGQLDRVEDIKILIDRVDTISPHHLGTLLLALEENAGQLIIYTVAAASQSARAGLKEGDQVLLIDGETPRDEEDARELMSGLPGTEVRITIQRRGHTSEIVVPRETFLH